MNTLPAADQFRKETVQILHQCISFSACIWATGTRDTSGTIKIAPAPPCYTEGLSPSFVTDYSGIAHKDVVGSFFSAFPRTVQRISVSDYRSRLGGRPGVEMATYLESIGIGYLMLTGIESRFGVAWITFYRSNATIVGPLCPFNNLDAEIAAYSVPHWLYTWQKLENGPSELTAAAEYWSMGMVPRLLGLTPTEVTVAALRVRGLSAEKIARALKRAGKKKANSNTVGVHVKHIQKKLGPDCETLTRALLGPLPGE